MVDRDSVPLGDEQVRRFIADGFIVLDAALMAAVDYLETYRWDPVHHRFCRAMLKARAAA